MLQGISELHNAGYVHAAVLKENIFYECFFTQDDIDSWLSRNLARLNAPEESPEGIVYSAKSQPLPPPSLESAMECRFILGGFGSGEYRFVLYLVCLRVYSD